MKHALLRSVCLLFLTLPAAAAADEEPTYLRAAALVDPLNGEVVADPVVEIRGERIVSVTSGGAVPPDAEIIDLGEATLLPGFADLHTHLTYSVTDFGYESLAVSVPDEAIRGVQNAQKTLMAGFTAARNLGASGYADVSLRNAID